MVNTDSTEHEVDVLIMATGFKIFERGNAPPFTVHGRDDVELGEWWERTRYQAYEGATVPGFPNLISILGPYGYNGSSYFTLTESQARHIVHCLTEAAERGATRVAIKRAAHIAPSPKQYHAAYWTLGS